MLPGKAVTVSRRRQETGFCRKTPKNSSRAASAPTYTVTDIQVKPGKKDTGSPFTTSTLQQEASVSWVIPFSRTMLLAQKLYEAVKITYMVRTASTSASLAMNAAFRPDQEFNSETKYVQSGNSRIE